MFTGLIQTVGRVEGIVDSANARDFTFNSPTIAKSVAIDDSVAVNGCCLTVTSHSNESFSATAIEETLKKTTLGLMTVNSPVNLELAMRLGDRLGGHMVQGHVDCTSKVLEVIQLETSREIILALPTEWSRRVVPTGSICIDGVSLTIAEKLEGAFRVALIPHTLESTTLSELVVGDQVNIEYDILGKYIEALLEPWVSQVNLSLV